MENNQNKARVTIRILFRTLLVLGLIFAIFCSVKANMMSTSADDDVLRSFDSMAIPAATELQTEPNAESDSQIDEHKEGGVEEIETEEDTQPTETIPAATEPSAKVEAPTQIKQEHSIADEQKPTETKNPAQSQPAKTEKPTETQPVETKSAETSKPAQNETTETIKPTETKPAEPAVTYKVVNETVYVTSDTLNVRIGPGTEYAKVTTLKKNTKVQRVGIGSNGWSQIKLNGDIRYVSSKYLGKKQIPTVSFKSVNKNMYTAKEFVSIYSEPDTTSGAFVTIGSINYLMPTTGISADGKWIRVAYGERTGYMLATDLSDREIRQSVAEEMATRTCMIGRLFIDDVNIDVALFKQKLGVSSQAVVDADDSAAYLPDNGYYGFDIIADHRHQGFNGIKKAVSGSTIAMIDFGTYTKSYVCVKVFQGVNTKDDLVDMDRNPIAKQNDGGICMYTCNYDHTVTITFWQPV
jgi:uncharacterized protein YgiM (DUF1202 family)